LRLAFGLNELPEILPFSIAFIRLELGRGRLRTSKVGARRIVLRSDLNDWLAGVQAAAQIAAVKRASAGSEKS
jgi:hypothetical protein